MTCDGVVNERGEVCGRTRSTTTIPVVGGRFGTQDFILWEITWPPTSPLTPEQQPDEQQDKTADTNDDPSDGASAQPEEQRGSA